MSMALYPILLTLSQPVLAVLNKVMLSVSLPLDLKAISIKSRDQVLWVYLHFYLLQYINLTEWETSMHCP